jgi:DNA mismatch repair protein MSH5
LRPSAEFCFEAAKNKLVNLDLVAQDEHHTMFQTPSDYPVGGPYGQSYDAESGCQARLMRLARWIDLDSRLTVSFPIFELSSKA